MKTCALLLVLMFLLTALAACSSATATPALSNAALPPCHDSRAEYCQVANAGDVCFQPCADCRRFCLPAPPTPTPSPTYPGPTQTPNSFESPLPAPGAG